MSITEKPTASPNPPTTGNGHHVPAPASKKAGADQRPQPDSGGSIFSTIAWLVVFVLAGVAWYYHAEWWPKVAPALGLGPKAAPKIPPRVIPVVTATVQLKNMEVFINGLGTVTAFKTVTVRSRVEGELINVAFTEGQMVNEGDLLCEIDKRPFNVQLQQAEGQLARDEATLKSAELTLKRYQELILSKSITAQQLDEQRALVQQTTGAIQSDLAAVANAKLQLDYCHIVSPVTGRIGLRLVDQGNIVRANDPTGLAVITQLQPISLLFTIPQDDISRVQKAAVNNPDLAVTAFDRNLKTKLAEGKLLAIDNQVDSTTGTVRLKAIFDNEDGLLFPNQFVNARLLVDTKKDAIVVPNAAVQRGPTSTFVYVVQSDETVDLRNVTTGLTEGSETAIESGLQPGEIVVVEGLDKLQKGTSITTADKENAKGKGKPREKGHGREKESSNEKDQQPDSAAKKEKAEAAPTTGNKDSQ